MWKKTQINCIFNRPQLCYSSINFGIFGVYNSESFPILIANKIFHVTVLFTYLLLQLICGTGIICHSRHYCCVCQQSAWYSATRTRFRLKSLYLKGYTATRLTDKFQEKSCTKRGVNKLLKKLRNTSTVETGSSRPCSATHILSKNNYAFICLNISNILLNSVNILLTHKCAQHTQLHV